MINLRKEILEDLPLTYKANERCKPILAGRAAKELRDELFKFVIGSMQGSRMTVIIGPPGSGKSQMLFHVEYLSNEKRMHNFITILFSLGDKPINETDVLERIVSDQTFLKMVEECGTDDFSHFQKQLLQNLKAGEGISLEEEKILVNLIKNAVRVFQKKHGATAGIVLAFDAVDEHIRKISEEKIKDFIGTFRLLVDDISEGLCVVFALTRDTYEKIASVIRGDQTYERRLVPMSDPISGGLRELKVFMTTEAFEMVSLHMQNWAQRKGIKLPENPECIRNSFNTFPFTSDTIQLLWEAADGIPGWISFGCEEAFIRKYLSEETIDPIIGRSDVIEVIQNFGDRFPKFGDIKEKLRLEDRAPQIEKDLEFLATRMKEMHGDFNGIVKEGFGVFIKSLTPEIGVTDAPVVINKYDHKRYSCEFLINYKGEKKVCITFVKGPLITWRTAKKIGATLVNGQATHGISIHITDEKPHFERGPATEEFKDHNMDYRTVFLSLPIKERDIWKIVGFPEIDESQRPVFAQHLDKNLGVKEEILGLMQIKEPSKIEIRSLIEPLKSSRIYE